MGRPPKFTRTQLQQAALELVDEQGLEALSMRSLAAALGTGPMTLYNHVQDRADLDVLVADAVLADVRWTPDRPDDWRESATEIATAMWRAVRAHPRAIPLILTRRSRSRVLLDVAEVLLDALARSGRRGEALLHAFRAVTAFVVGAALGELSGPLAVRAGEPAAKAIARVRALPADRYPRLREIARVAARSKAEREFRSGLESLLAGLESGGRASAPPKRSSAAPRPACAPRARRRVPATAKGGSAKENSPTVNPGRSSARSARTARSGRS
jgi:AcrR family transcriptional regulator